MSPYTRGALFLIRLIACACILVSVVLLGSYAFYFVSKKPSHESKLMIALKCLPFIAGVWLWAKSYPLAKRLTEDFDE